MLRKEYRTNFLLVKKYNLVYGCTRLSFAEHCYYMANNNEIKDDKIYVINNHQILGKDLSKIAQIASDLEKLNYFCTAYYPLDCTLKIVDKKQAKKIFNRVLTEDFFSKMVKKMAQGTTVSSLITVLEEYREYYATEEEEQLYDEIRRKEDCTYRQIEPLLGKKIFDDILLHGYKEGSDIWKIKLNKAVKTLDKYIDEYCSNFASPDEAKKYYELTTKTARAEVESEFVQRQNLKKYLEWLKKEEHHYFNYEERLCIAFAVGYSYVNGLVESLGQSSYASSRALAKKFVDLKKKIDLENIQKLPVIMEKLTNQLKNGIPVEGTTMYRKMNVLDYLSSVTLSPKNLLLWLNSQHCDKKTILLWKEFVFYQMGYNNAYLTGNTKTSISPKLEKYIKNDFDAKAFTIVDSEEIFTHVLTDEEKIETYHELQKIFRFVHARLFYSALKAKYGFPEIIEPSKKVKQLKNY